MKNMYWGEYMRAKARKQRLHNDYILLIFILPSVIGLGVFYLWPFFISMYYAVVDNAATRNFVGIANLVDTWNNPAFRLAVRNTITFMVISIPVNMIFSLMLALLLKPLRPSVRRVLLVFFLLPLVIPSGSVVFFWQHFVAVNGMFNRLFFASDPINWLNSDHGMWFIILIFIWKNIGFNVILFQAGLDFIPKEYYEYAQVEGAGRLRQFWVVTVTYLGPTFLLIFILSVVNSFKVFREVYLLTGTHPNSSIYLLQHFINNQFTALNYQRMASASFYLFGFVFVLVVVLYWLQQRQTYL